MADAFTRSTAVAEATPRFAILGTAAYTDIEVGVKVKTSSIAATDKYGSAILRWVDASNYSIAELHLSPSDTLVVATVVAGVRTPLGSVPVDIASDVFYGIKVVCFASGVLVATVLDQNDARLAEVPASSTALATGGALASGKPGFADQSTGTAAATRTYDSFYAATPPAEPIALYSGRRLEARATDTIREDAAGTYWGPVPMRRGGNFLVPPAGDKGRTSRVLVKAHRNDIEAAASENVTDALQAQIAYTPRYLAVPR